MEDDSNKILEITDVTTMHRSLTALVSTFLFALLSGCQSAGVKDYPLQSQSVDPAAELQTKLGTGYLREGQLELAWKNLNKALDADPRYSVAHNAMALLHEQLDTPEEARRHYQLAIKYNPTDSSAYTNYGSFLPSW